MKSLIAVGRGVAVLAFTFATATAAAAIVVPATLAAPSPQALTLEAKATGVQIYRCEADKRDPASTAWILTSPEAALHNETGKPMGKHYGGPTWEAVDGSKVVGEVVAKSEAGIPDAIPWLLLRAKSRSGVGVFGNVQSIQRLGTLGGAAPAGGCNSARLGAEVRVKYTAVYRFYE